MIATSMRAFGALAAAWGTLLAAPAAAQLSTTANGPYFAMPSWSQQLATNRFVVLANWNSEAVLDRETGVVWERSPDLTQRTWEDAQRHCIDRAVGGRKGWRLPHIQELSSLVDPAIPTPAPTTLPSGHPFLAEPVTVWSATASVEFPFAAWRVLFPRGLAGPINKTSALSAWCVRGGVAPDAQ